MKLKVRSEYYKIPDDLYDRYVALYAAQENAEEMRKGQEYRDIITYTNIERMNIHGEILKALGVFPTYIPVFNAYFLDRVQKDAHVVIFNPQLSAHVNNKIKLNMLFDDVKQLAVERKEAMDRFCAEYELQYGKELPDHIPDSDGVEWQDVLLWGIKDLPLDDFLAVLAESELE